MKTSVDRIEKRKWEKGSAYKNIKIGVYKTLVDWARLREQTGGHASNRTSGDALDLSIRR